MAALDIPLVGWLLSVAAFLTGTIVPMLHRRFSHEGLVVRQWVGYRGISCDAESGDIQFTMVFKVANASRSTAMIDEAELGSERVGDLRLEPLSATFHISPVDRQDFSHVLEAQIFFPMLVRPDTEMILLADLHYRLPAFSPAELDQVMFRLASATVPLTLRINGKSRKYRLSLRPGDSLWSGG